MAVVRAENALTFTIDDGVRVTGLTAPSRGASEICTWRLEIEPNVKGEAHWLDHEEIFIMLDGSVTFSVAGEDIELHAGDALSVPARSLIQFVHGEKTTAHLIVCLPVGARGTMADGREVGVPQWAR
jgi:quercetin dioxygenase-like cupin family protein